MHYKRVPANTFSYKYSYTNSSHMYYSTQLYQPCFPIKLCIRYHSMPVSQSINPYTIYKWINCALFASGHMNWSLLMIPIKTTSVYTQDRATHLVNYIKPINSTIKTMEPKTYSSAWQVLFLESSSYKYRQILQTLSHSLLKIYLTNKDILTRIIKCSPIPKLVYN